MVSREMPDPIATEFRRTYEEQNLGLSVKIALENLVERVPILDLKICITAIMIQRETGGNLAEILEKVAGTIRERDRVRRQVRVLSAEGRISAIVLVALPLLLALALSVMNPGYVGELTRGTGLVLSGIGVAMLAAGSIWMSRLVKVEY